MSKRLLGTAIAATGLMIGSAAHANNHEKGEAMMTPVVAEDGKTVMFGDKEVAVCTKELQDSCINPREAGLNWGNRPLDYWPGKPASEKTPAS